MEAHAPLALAPALDAERPRQCAAANINGFLPGWAHAHNADVLDLLHLEYGAARGRHAKLVPTACQVANRGQVKLELGLVPAALAEIHRTGVCGVRTCRSCPSP